VQVLTVGFRAITLFIQEPKTGSGIMEYECADSNAWHRFAPLDYYWASKDVYRVPFLEREREREREKRIYWYVDTSF
jgi:hypothetical protein